VSKRERKGKREENREISGHVKGSKTSTTDVLKLINGDDKIRNVMKL
jgi:hypothetical protein